MKWLEFIFPRLCLSCNESCSTSYLCPDCWRLCAPLDPASRCRHCFAELSSFSDLCLLCRTQKTFPGISAYVFDSQSPASHLPLHPAIVGFAFIQWLQLDWPVPDLLFSPSDLGKDLAELIQCPFAPTAAMFQDAVEEDRTFLFFAITQEALRESMSGFEKKCMKKIYVLSLFNS